MYPSLSNALFMLPALGYLRALVMESEYNCISGAKTGTTRATCIIIAITTESLLRVHLRKQEKGNKGS